MFNIKGLTKKYGKAIVVNDVTFSLGEHRCVALLGPNGAGKTTVLRMLTGAIKPSAGTIQFQQETNNDLRELIGYLPQHPVFYPWMTGTQYLLHCAKIHGIQKTEANIRTHELLDQVGLTDAKHKQIGTYSGGMKQRLGISQAIIHRPKLLLLDEPVSALDPIGRRDVLNLMETLKKEMTILFSTHILNDADEISDDLILLHEGAVIESGNMLDLRKKYETTMIELQFDTRATEYIEALHAIPSILDISPGSTTLHITATNIADARQDILQKCMSEQWPLQSFAVNKASLEDMFMKAVQSCNG